MRKVSLGRVTHGTLKAVVSYLDRTAAPPRALTPALQPFASKFQALGYRQIPEKHGWSAAFEKGEISVQLSEQMGSSPPKFLFSFNDNTGSLLTTSLGFDDRDPFYSEPSTSDPEEVPALVSTAEKAHQAGQRFLYPEGKPSPDLAKQKQTGPDKPDDTVTQGGVEVMLWFGAKGGGYAPPPSWVPPKISSRYQKAWQDKDSEDLEERYGPDDDGLQRSEVDFDDAAGFTAIASKEVSDVAGIDHFTTTPIPFTHDGKKLVIWGGVSGV